MRKERRPMAKRYTRINWQDKPSTATPISATNLNKMDKGIDDCDNAIEQLNDNLVNFVAMDGGSFSIDTYTRIEAVTNIYNALPRDNTIYSVTFKYGAAYAAIIQRYNSTHGCAIVFGYGVGAPEFYRLSGGTWTQHSFSIT
jgi:hypothetical protein